MFDTGDVLPAFIHAVLKTDSERTHETIAGQNTEKGADQGGRYAMTDFGRRAVNFRHSDHDTQHCRYDSQTGQRVGGSTQRCWWLHLSFMHGFNVGVHQVFQIMRLDRA